MTRLPQLRQASPSDAAALAALEGRVFPAGPWGRRSLETTLSRPGATCVVVEQAGGLVGYALGWAAAGEGELLRIGVDPSARRQGLGRQLLSGFLAAQRRAGAHQTFLEVRQDNTPARALYQRLGFAEVGRRPRYYPDGTDAILSLFDPSAPC